MVRLQSGAIVRLLSRTGNSKLDIKTSLDIPTGIWSRMQKEMAEYNGSRCSQSPPYLLLKQLFERNNKPLQRVLLGSLLADYNKQLPLHLETSYIKSLVASGMNVQALRRWRQRKLSSVEEPARWLNLGAQCLCGCYQVVEAERIVKSGQTLVDSALCMSFITAYASLRQTSHVGIWSELIFTHDTSAAVANKILRVVIAAKMWPQVRVIIQRMSEREFKVETDLIAKCIGSASDGVSSLDVARLLAENGDLVNGHSFRYALRSDARNHLSTLLRSRDKFDEAYNFVMSYTGPLSISLCYQLLQYHKNALRLGETLLSRKFNIEDLLLKVKSSNVRNSMYVQFMLSYYQVTGDDTLLRKIASEHGLFTFAPKQQLSYSNYLLMWSIMRDILARPSERGAHLAYKNLPVSLRHLILITVEKSGLTSRMLRLILACLRIVPDVPAIVAIVNFAADNYGANLESQDLVKILNGKSSTTDSEKELTKEEFVLRLCDSQHLDPTHVHHQSREYRRMLNSVTGSDAPI